MNDKEFVLEVTKKAVETAGKECSNKLSTFFGQIFPELPLKKEALETYVTEIKASDMTPEAKMLAIGNAGRTYKQLSNQFKIAAIAHDSAKKGTDFSAQSEVDDDWLDKFMDAAKFVSDEEVQLIWGNILAGEFEQPGSTPPSVIRILSELTTKYAKAFMCLCNCTVYVTPYNSAGAAEGKVSCVMVPTDYEYLEQYGINFMLLNELRLLGLIQFDSTSGYIQKWDAETYPKLLLMYGDKEIQIESYASNAFPIGCVYLTRAGISIGRFADDGVIEGHFDAVLKYLRENNVVFRDDGTI